MKALDTNVLVCFLVSDDPQQARRVKKRLADAELSGESFHVSQLVLLETIWVLSAAYDYGRAEILEALEALLHMPVLRFEAPEVAHRLVARGRTSRIDLADLFIGLTACEHGCDTTLTFDRNAAKFEWFERI